MCFDITFVVHYYFAKIYVYFTRETSRNDLEINELDRNIVYDRTSWRNLIHVTDPT